MLEAILHNYKKTTYKNIGDDEIDLDVTVCTCLDAYCFIVVTNSTPATQKDEMINDMAMKKKQQMMEARMGKRVLTRPATGGFMGELEGVQVRGHPFKRSELLGENRRGS